MYELPLHFMPSAFLACTLNSAAQKGSDFADDFKRSFLCVVACCNNAVDVLHDCAGYGRLVHGVYMNATHTV